jgi:hypothetical protein
MKLLVIAALSLRILCAQAKPDEKLTPGALDPKVTGQTIEKTICRHGYTAAVRDVSEATKKEVMARYGLDPRNLHDYEIDHWVSLEVGGLNTITNLWPQPIAEAREKDVVETWLHRQVCKGAMTLKEAQSEIPLWPQVYKKIEAK